jgi:alpha-beta hydrolase superfamily lysophospholipase
MVPKALPSAVRRHPVLARVAFYAAVLLVALPAALALAITRPARRSPAPTPAGYVERFVTADGLRLRVWSRPGPPSRPAVVVVHGVGDSMESFLDTAAAFARRGHAVALLDTRGHGGSEGRVVTFGAREREDVRAALDALRAEAPAGFVLVGHSMGAVAALRAAAGRGDVRAVIAEAPYDTFPRTIAHHAWLLYRMPRWFPVVPLTAAFAGAWGGFDPRELDAVAAASRCACALLAIADGADDRMPEAVVRRVFDAHPGPKALWVAPGMPHVGAALHPDYRPTIDRFLRANGV